MSHRNFLTKMYHETQAVFLPWIVFNANGLGPKNKKPAFREQGEEERQPKEALCLSDRRECLPLPSHKEEARILTCRHPLLRPMVDFSVNFGQMGLNLLDRGVLRG